MSLLFTAHAEIRTLTLDSSITNSSETITISDQQTIELKAVSPVTTWCGSNNGPFLHWNVHGLAFTNNVGFQPAGWIFSGPASVRIFSPSCPVSGTVATFAIEPSAFPPDKTLTLGAFSGNVKVTMEQSTDLVNWTPAVNAAIYTNAPDARFFRIKMEKNAPPP